MTVPARTSTGGSLGANEVPTARSLLWSLQAGGWSEHEAGNLVALASGLWPSHSGWSTREIEHLRWIKALHSSGRLTS